MSFCGSRKTIGYMMLIDSVFRGTYAHVQGASLKAYGADCSRFSSPGIQTRRLESGEKALQMTVIDFATRRPMGAPAPLIESYTLTEPPRLRSRHPLDLVDVTAVVHKELGDSLLPSIEELSKQAGRERRLRPLHPAGEELDEAPFPLAIFYREEWENDSGAWVLGALLTRRCASIFISKLHKAGVFESLCGEEEAAG